MTLEHNEIVSISALQPLSALPNLEHLSIRGNLISTVDTTDQPISFQFPTTLRSLDLSRNDITSWTILNKLPTIFPGLATLRISSNPLFDQSPLPPSSAAQASDTKPMTVDEAFMLTLSRFPPTLTILNYSTISPQDRMNAEMYYLSLIGKELSATAEAEEPTILATHPRYSELCSLYVEPTITRAAVSDPFGARAIHPRSVAARLVRMALRLHTGSNDTSKDRVVVKEIPGSFDTYQVKALVSRLFGVPVFGLRLIWETDEWDPIEKEAADETVDWDDDSEDESQYDQPGPGVDRPDQTRFMRREVDLVDSTRDIGFLFQGEVGVVKIRVDIPGTVLE